MAKIRINDPELLQTIVAELQERPDVVASIVGPDTIEISLLGSYQREAMNLAVYLRIRAWEAAKRVQGYDVHVEIL